MNSEIIIYGLFDPRNGECFYIGKTINLYKRNNEHINNKKKNNLYKYNKVKKILKLGLKPELKELYSFKNYEDKSLRKEGGYNNWWEHVERYYINYYKNVLKQPLTNITEGGDQGSNRNKKVFQYDLNGKFIKEYESLKIAAKENNISYSCISLCCHNKIKSAKKFQWSFECKEMKKYINNYGLQFCKSVLQFDLNGNFIIEYKSTKDVERKLGIPNSYISKCCLNQRKKSNGFIWKYAS